MHEPVASLGFKLTCLARTMTLFHVSELSKGRERTRAGRACALRAQHSSRSAARTQRFIFPQNSFTDELSDRSDHLSNQFQ